MEAQGTWVLFYSGVGSVLSQQHRLATSSLSFLSVRRVLSKKKMVRKLAMAMAMDLVTYFFATHSANKEKRDCP